MSTITKGTRIEIPVHYDLWMRGAKYGTITQFRNGRDGKSDCWFVKMDHPQVKKRLKLWKIDWDYSRIIGGEA